MVMARGWEEEETGRCSMVKKLQLYNISSKEGLSNMLLIINNIMYLTFGSRENHVMCSYHTFTQKAKKHKETCGEDV